MHHIDQKGLAQRWSLSPRTLEQWRWQGRGPRYLKIGGRVVYRLSDIEAFEAARLHSNTIGPDEQGTRSADARSPAGNLDPPPLRAHAGPAGSRARASASSTGSEMRARASRRQPNSCCGLSPCRRATSDTLAPGLRLSTTMRALSSSDHRRRRPVPVISSMRRTDVTASSPPSSGLLSSVCSSVWSNRSLMARHQATDRASPECGAGAPLTLNQLVSDESVSCRQKIVELEEIQRGITPMSLP